MKKHLLQQAVEASMGEFAWLLNEKKEDNRLYGRLRPDKVHVLNPRVFLKVKDESVEQTVPITKLLKETI